MAEGWKRNRLDTEPHSAPTIPAFEATTELKFLEQLPPPRQRDTARNNLEIVVVCSSRALLFLSRFSSIRFDSIQSLDRWCLESEDFEIIAGEDKSEVKLGLIDDEFQKFTKNCNCDSF